MNTEFALASAFGFVFEPEQPRLYNLDELTEISCNLYEQSVGYVTGLPYEELPNWSLELLARLNVASLARKALEEDFEGAGGVGALTLLNRIYKGIYDHVNELTDNGQYRHPAWGNPDWKAPAAETPLWSPEEREQIAMMHAEAEQADLFHGVA